MLYSFDIQQHHHLWVSVCECVFIGLFLSLPSLKCEDVSVLLSNHSFFSSSSSSSVCSIVIIIDLLFTIKHKFYCRHTHTHRCVYVYIYMRSFSSADGFNCINEIYSKIVSFFLSPFFFVARLVVRQE